MGLGFGLQVQGLAQKQTLSIKVTPSTLPASSFTSVPANTAGIVSTDINQTVTVTLTAGTGWSLDHWELDGVNKGSANPFTVTMNTNHLLIAVMLLQGGASFAYGGQGGVLASLGTTTPSTTVKASSTGDATVAVSVASTNSQTTGGNVAVSVNPTTANSVSTGGDVRLVLTGGSTGANPNAKGVISSFTTAGSGADPLGWKPVLRWEEDLSLTW